MDKNYRAIISLWAVTFVLFIVSLYMIFAFVPTEATMGVVQRIFYYHVPLAWISFLAFFVLFLGCIMFLWKRDQKWDVLASTAAEIGFVLTTLFLITGSIWAKPIWGVWWTWDPRLTSALVLWLIYIAYLMVRSYAVDEARGARFASVVGIVGFFDVPIVALAIVLWRTQHPSPVIFSGGLEPSMLATLLVSLSAYTALYALLQILRVSIKNDEITLSRLKVRLD
ncbi:cytochrome c biogenesis protein [Chloroflexota bacterium]